MNRQKDTNALNLTGGEYALISDDVLARFVEGDTFTVSFWMQNPNTIDTSIRTMFNIDDDDGAANRFRIEHTTSNDRLYFVAEGGSGTDIDWSVTSQDLNDGDWHHIVLVNTSTTSRELFVDGASIGTHTTSYTQPTSVFNTITTGVKRQASTLSNYCYGSIDDVALYSDVLTDAEILRNYNAGKRSHR
tara:strand:- start:5 stop:571 length:567 start_codon:yes stop_codon:yes gene_type:complete